jgi:hypothetical protein
MYTPPGQLGCRHRRHSTRTVATALVLICSFLALQLTLFSAGALAATTSTSTSPLTFGIYPGGPAGGASGSTPDNVSKDLAAVQQLDSSRAPFVVHLYAEYYGPGGATAQQEIGSELQTFAGAGVKVELVVCYRPADKSPTVDVPGFVSWIQAALKAFGAQLSYLQVTNEANRTTDPTSNDGAFAGVKGALILGVEAAKNYVTANNEAIKVGFNWSYDASVQSNTFWSSLKATGGSTFVHDVDWVGIDVYPGTWQPIPAGLHIGDGSAQVMDQAIAATRNTYMPLAGLPATVPIHISETGYPTGPGRTYAMQAAALSGEVRAVESVSATDNVTDFRLFDLRDAITNSTIFADQYGLMTDQWVAKPAFAEYESFISASLG